MTQLIDCYGSIESQLNKLHISSIHPIPTQQYSDRIYSYQYFRLLNSQIVSSITKTNLNYFTVDENFIKGYIEINGLYQPLFGFGFDIFCKVRFLCHTAQIVVFSTLLKNGLPLQIHHKFQRITINKFVLKVNSSLKYGSFRLDPLNGQFTLCLHSSMTISQFETILAKPYNLSEYLEEQFLKSKYYYRAYLFKILLITNQISENHLKIPQLANNKIKLINPAIHEIQLLLRKIFPTAHLEYPFMYSQTIYSGTKILNVEQLKKLVDAIKTSKTVKKQIPNQILDFLKYLCHFKKQPKIDDTFTEEQKKIFISKLIQPIAKYQNGQLQTVYSQIQILNQEINWEMIDHGGFGIISKGLTQFVYKQDKIDKDLLSPISDNNLAPMKVFTRIIVKKEDFSDNSKKLHHQKKILSTLKNSSTPFITRFYFSQQQKYKNTLLMQYCPQKSLSSIKLRYNQFLSFNSKLTYLKYIAQGIKFMKDHDIVHLDIKPGNILFSSGIVKFTDFGQAYHYQICNKSTSLGIVGRFQTWSIDTICTTLVIFTQLCQFQSQNGYLQFRHPHLLTSLRDLPIRLLQLEIRALPQSLPLKNLSEIPRSRTRKNQYGGLYKNTSLLEISVIKVPGRGRKEKTMYRMGNHYFTILLIFINANLYLMGFDFDIALSLLVIAIKQFSKQKQNSNILSLPKFYFSH